MSDIPKYLDHEFPNKLALFCSGCGFTQQALRNVGVTCAELKRISATHKWVNRKNDYPVCKICSMRGSASKKLALLYLNKLYTCNEYLMIKANE